MDALTTTLERLAALPEWGYRAGSPAAAEPTALAALALESHGQTAAAQRARSQLIEMQQPEGCVGVSRTQTAPHWPTGLAVLAWCAPRAAAADRLADNPAANHIRSAIQWMFTIKGKPSERSPELGHDTTLVGWPWVETTHTWLEPTAWCLLALKGVRQASHTRAREAVRVLIDRQLPGGGCNYGNTFVLGQELRPHLEPSGLALIALAGEGDNPQPMGKTVAWVESQVGPAATIISLSYALIGLAAHERLPKASHEWIVTALARSERRGASPLSMAWALLAAQGAQCPLITLAQGGSAA